MGEDVRALVREKNLGPHKVMIDIWMGVQGILRQKIFEFMVSKMAFPAF